MSVVAGDKFPVPSTAYALIAVAEYSMAPVTGVNVTAVLLPVTAGVAVNLLLLAVSRVDPSYKSTFVA